MQALLEDFALAIQTTRSRVAAHGAIRKTDLIGSPEPVSDLAR